MLSQQETFKLGEWSPEAGRFACLACDRVGTGTVIDVDAGEAFPFCPACKAANRAEPDQLFIRAGELAGWKSREQGRWRAIWKP
jgi:hypothetical protein